MTAAEPGRSRPPTIVVCADDFGLSAAGSEVILDLLERGAINATSCLVDSAAWPTMGRALRRAADRRRGLAAGLHLNLTEALPGCAAPEAIAGLPAQLARSFGPRRGSSHRAWLRSVRAQWSAFVEVFGREPDFIDGHEHVHLIPGPRQAVLEVIAEIGHRGWVRQCRTSSRRLNWKRAILDPLGAAFASRARRAGVSCNPGFGGLRAFNAIEDVEQIWRIDLAAMTGGGVLMVHPGAADPNDPIGRSRRQEAELLANAAATGLMDRLGLRLALDAVRPW